MHHKTHRRPIATLTSAAMLAVFIPASLAVGGSSDYQRVLKDKTDALVTVKFVLKMTMGGAMAGMGMGDQETETEITGVLISPNGLVLCSNTQLEGFSAMMNRMMSSMGGSITATPTDIKILVGDDTEGVEGELLARDSELDLAWIKIKEPPRKKLAHVDLSAAARPVIGQRVVAVRRMGKYFGRSPVVLEGRITGMTSKPRDLLIPSIAIAMAQGLPVYTDDGKVVGVTILQLPEAEDTGGGMNPMAMIGNLSSMQDMMMGLILPAAEAARATKRALESASSE